MVPDGMPQKELKVLANVIARVISIIFERSQPSGEIPNDWKKANITPIFKKKQEQSGELQARLTSLLSTPTRLWGKFS